MIKLTSIQASGEWQVMSSMPRMHLAPAYVTMATRAASCVIYSPPYHPALLKWSRWAAHAGALLGFPRTRCLLSQNCSAPAVHNSRAKRQRLIVRLSCSCDAWQRHRPECCIPVPVPQTCCVQTAQFVSATRQKMSKASTTRKCNRC